MAISWSKDAICGDGLQAVRNLIQQWQAIVPAACRLGLSSSSDILACYVYNSPAWWIRLYIVLPALWFVICPSSCRDPRPRWHTLIMIWQQIRMPVPVGILCMGNFLCKNPMVVLALVGDGVSMGMPFKLIVKGHLAEGICSRRSWATGTWGH